MQTQSLQKKRALRNALLVLLGVVGMTKMYAYDFSAVCSTGQTLYYNIIDSSNHYAELTCPGGASLSSCWAGYTKPTGDIVLPDQVEHNGISYTITRIGDYAFCGCSDLTGLLVIPDAVTEIGIHAFSDCDFSGNLTIPNSVTTIGYCAFRYCEFTGDLTIPNSVTHIGGYAFQYCLYFTGDLTIGNSVTSIEGGAFDNCSGFTKITYNAINCEDKNYGDYPPFNGCNGIRTLIIGENIKRIPKSLFKHAFNKIYYNAINCEDLESSPFFYGTCHLYIGENVEIIPANLCSGCGIFYSDLVIPNSVTEIGDNAFLGSGFNGRLTIGNSVSTIGTSAFANCNFYGNLIIPNSVTMIGSGAFRNCSDFTGELIIPNSVTMIGDGAFWNCSGFTGDLIIPNSVTMIGSGAFLNCSGFTGNLTIGNSVTSIGEFAFGNCSGLTSVIFTGDISQWCSVSFGNVHSNPLNTAHNLYINNELVTNLNIPESVTKIKDYAFYGCSCIKALTIPYSVDSIGNSAFSYCDELTSIDYYSENCSFIQEQAFSNCPISTVTIGENVHAIPSGAFKGCTTLNTIIAFPTTPPTLGTNAFTNIAPVAALFVPCGSQMAYFSNWNIFEYNNIHEDCTPRPVSTSSNIVGGTVSPSVSEATMGQEVTFAVTPNAGMQLVSTTVYNTNNPSQIVPVSVITEVPNPIYKFNMPTFAVTISATFEHGASYSISISPNITGGIVTASTSTASAGETVTLNVHPNPGYELRSLTVCNADDASETVAVNNNTFIMPSFNVLVSASFGFTSVDENGISSVTIYPNPTQGQVKIEAEDLKYITINNMLGQVIYEGKACGNEFTYDFGQQGEGVYLIRIETASGVVTKRVSVTR